MVSLHNVEANEAPNWIGAFRAEHFYREPNREKLNEQRCSGAIQRRGLHGGLSCNPNGSGRDEFAALYGWIAAHLGAMDLAYEVNDRDPGNRLSVPRLKEMGSILAEQLGAWLESDEGRKRHIEARAALETRKAERAKFYAEQGAPKSQSARDADLLTQGF